LPRKRDGRGFGWLRLRWLLVLALVVPAVSYTVSVDMKVRSQFEGRRWALPARVYARPLELYPDMQLSAEELENELRTLGYEQTAELQGSGAYKRNGNDFYIITRPFKFWDADEPSRMVRARLSKEGRLSQLTDLSNRDQLSLARLDPLMIGKVYPTHHEDRILINLPEVPPLLVKALVAMEDRNFYEHSGVSLRAVARAMMENARAGEWVQGGSTITQQLIKNYYLSPEPTLSRKVNEAMMAILLEWHYSKDEIMEAYLNEVYLGQAGNYSIHGMGMGAWFYFNRPVSQLGLPEVALLVALVRGASYYNPRKHPDRALKRRDLVIDLMLEQGMISSVEALEAKSAPLDVVEEIPQSFSPYPAFLELVRRQLQTDYREEDLQSEGLQVFTTLDPYIQRRAEKALIERSAQLEKDNKIRKLEGAIIVTGMENGEVLAMVGGRSPRYSGFNRAMDAQRPIGSLVKPAVYLTALENYRSYSLLSALNDRPFEWHDKQTGKTWTPSNYDGKAHGNVALYRALANSYNLATVHLGFELGLKKVQNTLVRLGVDREFPVYPSMLLGSIALSPMEVTQMYQTIATGGFRLPLRAIRNVLTYDGKPLNQYALSMEQRFDPAPVFLLNYALQQAVREGTGRMVAKDLPEEWILAGKTGTTNDFRDSWFVGYGGDVLAVTWLGRDDNRPIGLSGSAGAMRVWADLMQDLRPRPFIPVTPARIQWRAVGSRNGNAIRVPFISGESQMATFDATKAAATVIEDSPPAESDDVDPALKLPETE
jgi:penicillin-binding protein 1B